MTGSFASDAIPNLGLTNIESPFLNHTVKFKIRFFLLDTIKKTYTMLTPIM